MCATIHTWAMERQQRLTFLLLVISLSNLPAAEGQRRSQQQQQRQQYPPLPTELPPDQQQYGGPHRTLGNPDPPMHGGLPMYPAGAPIYPGGGSMYGSGAIPSINRNGQGAGRIIPQHYDRAIPFGQMPPPQLPYGPGMQVMQRGMYPGYGAAAGGAAGIPILYGGGRAYPPPYENGRAYPPLYGRGQGLPYQPVAGDVPSYRNGAGSPMRNGGGQFRQLGPEPGLYESDVVPDDLMYPVPRPGAEGACTPNCKPHEFACVKSCTCIPKSWQCDGDSDCVFSEDEAGCLVVEPPNGNEECLPSEHNVRCPRTGKCIRDQWLCDGEDDCGDFTDETHCGYESNCTAEQFMCDNGLCIKASWRCDGDNDCIDYSDELNCTKKSNERLYHAQRAVQQLTKEARTKRRQSEKLKQCRNERADDYDPVMY